MFNAVDSPQSILILGGSSEIGLAIASEFLVRGPARVILAVVPGDPTADAAADTMRKAGATSVELIDYDATKPETHPETIEKALPEAMSTSLSSLPVCSSTTKRSGRTSARP